MKHPHYGLVALVCLAASAIILGCGSGLRVMPKTAASKVPPKNSSDWAIKNNPNIPESAKKAMLGGKY